MTNFWQATKQYKQTVKVEHENRLYYDDAGQPVTYSQEDLSGNYIIVDQQTFNECRMDVRIVDGKVTRPNMITEFRKLVPSDEGVETLVEDVTIVGQGQYWKTKYYAD